MKEVASPEVKVGGPRPPMSLTKFVREMDVTAVTAWRWRNQGKLRAVNICGRLYVPQDAIEEFNARAAAGEFAKEHTTPRRNSTPAVKTSRRRK